MNYPLTITETSARGITKEWTLYSEDHMNDIIQKADGYDEIAEENGYLVYDSGWMDGRITYEKDERHTLDCFLDWLRHDAQAVTVEETPEPTPTIKSTNNQLKR